MDAEIAELRLQLERAQQALMEREKLATLGSLVATVAHEINTPIGIAVTAASGMEAFSRRLAELLKAERVSRSELQGLAEQLASAASLVGTNLARAAALVGSFKTMAVDQATEQPLAFELGEYLRGVLRAHQPVLRRAQVQVELHQSEPLPVSMAAGMLSQILSNLLLNALNHAFEGITERRIDLWLRGLDAQRIELRLRDNGVGASGEVRARLFEPFFTTKRGAGGSGLGLPIVQTLCRRMGGAVQLDETPGPGLGFVITLPRRAAQAPAGAAG